MNCSNISVFDLWNILIVGSWLNKNTKWTAAIKKHLMFEKNENSGFYFGFALPKDGIAIHDSLKADFEMHVRKHMEPGKQELLEEIADIDIDAVTGFESLYVKICFALVVYHARLQAEDACLQAEDARSQAEDARINPERLQELLEMFV